MRARFVLAAVVTVFFSGCATLHKSSSGSCADTLLQATLRLESDSNSLLGSAVVVDSSRRAITSPHVVAGKKEIRYRTLDACIGKATVVAFHERDDVAVLELDQSCPRIAALQLSATDSHAGDDVFAAGHPGGLDWSLTKGIVANESRALPESGNDVKYLQLDVASFEGGSGGPVVDSQCSVVGMISRGALRGLISFAVPASVIRSKFSEVSNWL